MVIPRPFFLHSFSGQPSTRALTVHTANQDSNSTPERLRVLLPVKNVERSCLHLPWADNVAMSDDAVDDAALHLLYQDFLKGKGI